MRYIIVVHGIGQQRKNESVRPVIERFAQARSTSGREIGKPITLGLMAGQLQEAPVGDVGTALEEGWIEFEGIPQRADGREQRPFVGRRTKEPGTNLRFVDLHWSSVTDSRLKAFGEPVADWTRALIDRLEIRNAPKWIPQFLRTMRAGVLPLQAVLRKRNPELAEEVFDRFLGDVQLYGEYQATRGMAVRRFHERMERLEADHYAKEKETNPGRPAREPRYVVIAHSLGTVMSFDALLFAHMKRSGFHEGALELLPEYDRNPSTEEQDHHVPDLEWIRNVDAFVTLGSPIDKFLAFWWLNYEHLVERKEDDRWADWVDPELLAMRQGSRKIPHYNYCDEQDPVGHNLDVAYSAGTVVEQIFSKQEDEVFTRYAVPGVAHVGYWTDSELFRRILDLTVDRRPLNEATPVAWFKWWTYVQALAWTYLLVPTLGFLAATTAAMWAVNGAQNFGTRMFWLLVSFGAFLFSCWLMRLMVEWREIVITRRRTSNLPPGQLVARQVLERVFLALVVVLPFIWLYLLIAAVASFPTMSLPDAAASLVKSAASLRDNINAWMPWSWNPVSQLVTWIRTQIDSVELLKPFVAVWDTNKRVLALVAGTYGFLIGTWNLLVFARIRWIFRHGAKALDFKNYVTRDDETRAEDRTP